MVKFFLTTSALLLTSIAIFAEVYSPQTQVQTRQVDQLKNELQKPMPAENEVTARVELAKRKAAAAVKLLQLGRPQDVWPLLRHSSDPTLRTYLIHMLAKNVKPR